MTDYLEMLRVGLTVLLAEYSVVATHVRHQDIAWQEKIWPWLPDNLNMDRYHFTSALRWPLTLSFLFWPHHLSLTEMGLTAGITAPLSWVVWKMTKKAAGKEAWGSFWSALFTGKR